MAFLQIQTGEKKGQKFEIDRDRVVMGRSHDNLICLESPAVSGEHCAIERDGRKFILKDLGSTNGTRLNSATIHEYRLSPKDVVSVGEIDILFDGNDIEPASTKSNPLIVTQVTAKMATASSHSASAPVQVHFAAKKNKRKTWVVVLIGLIVLVVATGAWFVLKLTQS